MKTKISLAVIAAMVLGISFAMAQQWPGRQRGGKGCQKGQMRGKMCQMRGNQGHCGRRGHHRGPSPLFVALDLNTNGELSADEISAASTSLLTLDADANGIITRDEICPRRGPRPPAAEGMVDRLMRHDKNGDGFLSTDEFLPRHAADMFEAADTNEDGLLNTTELEAWVATLPTPPAGQAQPEEEGEA